MNQSRIDANQTWHMIPQVHEAAKWLWRCAQRGRVAHVQHSLAKLHKSLKSAGSSASRRRNVGLESMLATQAICQAFDIAVANDWPDVVCVFLQTSTQRQFKSTHTPEQALDKAARFGSHATAAKMLTMRFTNGFSNGQRTKDQRQRDQKTKDQKTKDQRKSAQGKKNRGNQSKKEDKKNKFPCTTKGITQDYMEQHVVLCMALYNAASYGHARITSALLDTMFQPTRLAFTARIKKYAEEYASIVSRNRWRKFVQDVQQGLGTQGQNGQNEQQEQQHHQWQQEAQKAKMLNDTTTTQGAVQIALGRVAKNNFAISSCIAKCLIRAKANPKHVCWPATRCAATCCAATFNTDVPSDAHNPFDTHDDAPSAVITTLARQESQVGMVLGNCFMAACMLLTLCQTQMCHDAGRQYVLQNAVQDAGHQRNEQQMEQQMEQQNAIHIQFTGRRRRRRLESLRYLQTKKEWCS
jgi:hypothetical protein